MMEPLNPKWVMWVWIATGFTLLAYIPYNPIEHPVYNFLVSLYIYLFVFLNVQYIVEGSVARVYQEDCYDDWEDEP
jgi:hypothetical protein